MILIDANLSHRLKVALRDQFPGTVHVSDVQLSKADDDDIWHYARQHALHILTKDGDFENLLRQHGPPPKVIRIKIGNASTKTIGQVLTEKRAAIAAFLNDPAHSLLYITR